MAARSWRGCGCLAADARLRAPASSPAIAQVTQRLLDAAEVLYLRAEQGIAALPRDCRPAIHAARLVYAEIGEQLSRSGLDSITQRTVVPPSRKLALLARAAGAAFVAPAGQTQAMAPLPAIAYLVEAAEAPLAPELVGKESTVWQRFDERMARLMEMHARLVEHDRLTR